ncbi:MAG: hypothetical protein HQ568_11990, partial [Calditrichaeota bacterium]|nr:hypothetical protein [Calditrichota bacterium]
MKRISKTLSDEGNILIMSVAIAALLVATGLGYMKWATDERWDTAYEQATVQAYFLAQTGLIEKGYMYLRTRKPSELPTATVYLPSGYIPEVGSYFNTKVVVVATMGSENVFQRTDTYDLFCTGRAEFQNHQLGNRSYGQPVRVERTAKLRAKLRSFSNYMYLTDLETTRFDEIIWFWSYDSLYGRVHSNDFIGLKYSPHFYGPISTCQSRFLYNSPENIYFAFQPQFNVPEVMFPRRAETLRAAASPWISDGNGMYMTRVWMKGQNGITIYQYEIGMEAPSLYDPGEGAVNFHDLAPQNWGAIFIDGQVEVYGIHTGNLSIGSSGDMWLVDNIQYEGTRRYDGWIGDNSPEVQANFPYMLGLVSESNIIIQDNVYNGRSNGFRNYPNDHDQHSIIINAGMVALNESFTFEHQNDDFEFYQGPDPWDERGIIHLTGAVTQVRRGYVHRSNHSGTGYGKDYHYDFRFDVRPPPFYLEA